MFQAKPGSGNTAIVRSTRDAMSGTVASYAISDQQRATKRFWTTGITRASNKKICPHWFEV
jgi:hypothetical protein